MNVNIYINENWLDIMSVCMHVYVYIYTTVQKFGARIFFFLNVLKVSYAHEGCIYLLKILLQFKMPVFYLKFKFAAAAIIPVFSVT